MCNVKRRAKSSGVNCGSARTVTETATAYATVLWTSGLARTQAAIGQEETTRYFEKFWTLSRSAERLGLDSQWRRLWIKTHFWQRHRHCKAKRLASIQRNKTQRLRVSSTKTVRWRLNGCHLTRASVNIHNMGGRFVESVKHGGRWARKRWGMDSKA